MHLRELCWLLWVGVLCVVSEAAQSLSFTAQSQPVFHIRRQLHQPRLPHVVYTHWLECQEIPHLVYFQVLAGLRTHLSANLTSIVFADVAVDKQFHESCVQDLLQVKLEFFKTNLQTVPEHKQPGITSALCGAKRPEQIRESARAMTWQLSEKERQKIDDALRRRGRPAQDNAL